MNKVKLLGKIRAARNGKITGWAIDLGNPTQAINLDCYINGVKVQITTANKNFAWMPKNTTLPTENSGFSFEGIKMNEGDVIRIFLMGGGRELLNSPFIFHTDPKKRNQKSNVLIMGLNKSGTSILTYQIARGLSGSKINFEPNNVKGQNDIDTHIKILRNTHQVTKCLYYPTRPHQINKIAQGYNKCVWIYRDPRDIIISAFLYRWFKGHNPSREQFESCYKRILEKEKAPKEIAFVDISKNLFDIKNKIASTYLPLCETISKLPKYWHKLKYEDLIDREIDPLNEYLGFVIDDSETIDPSISRVARSKGYGNWRDWFTEKDVEILKPLLFDILKTLDYNPHDWQLNDPPTLNPQLGSVYMRKLMNG